MAARLLCVIAFIAVLSQFGKTVFDLVGLPNVIPLVRDGVLLSLAAVAISRTDVFKSRGFYLPVLLYLLLLIVNIGIAAWGHAHAAGLYYARLYFLPLVSAVAVRGLIAQAPEAQIQGLIRTVFVCGSVVMAAAFMIFMAVEFNPQLLHTLMGGQDGQRLATAWYISGGTWLRMGLPATSPNALGLMLTFYLMLIFSVLMDGRYLKLGVWAKALVLFATVMAIAMTFSRSSWIALILGGLVILALCYREWGLGSPAMLFKLAATLMGLAALIVGALVYLDIYSGGYISQWITLNKEGSDPSMIGHGDSFVIAIEALPEYFWQGYPKGTVGARALIFGDVINNVENSILSVFFEMGVPLGVIFWALVAGVLRGLWVHKSQWGMLAGFAFCSMLLPYVFEPDIITLFLVLSVLLGRALQCSAEAAAQDAPAQSVTHQLRRSSARTAFQATRFEPR